jgi:hypothetical protein
MSSFAVLEKRALKNSRTGSAAAKGHAADSTCPRLFEASTSFWFKPVEPVGLHTIRFLTGLLLMFWLIMFAGNQTSFFGLSGWVDRATAASVRSDFLTGWSVLNLFESNSIWVHTVYWVSIVTFGLFAVGLWTRITSVLTWLLVVSFIANPVTRLDAEPLLGMLAFYLMVGYVLMGQWSREVSWRERFLGSNQTLFFGSREQPTSVAANLAIRLLQVHFALVVVTSGLHKLQNGDWWAGVAFWYPLHPPFETTAESLAAVSTHANRQLFFLSLTQYMFLAWELGFPLFAWRKKWRAVLLGGTVIGWMGCLAIYKQPLFGPIYCICAFSYLTPAEWSGIFDRLRFAQDWILGRERGTLVRHGSKVS